MSRYRLTEAADTDLAAIFWDGMERFGARQTEQYLTRLETLFAHIAAFPDSTRLRTELEPPVHAYPTDAHIIVYEIAEREVVILRIRSARENWTASPLGEDAP